MLIHLIASMRHFDEDVTILEKISDTLEANSVTIIRNWHAAVKSRRNRQSVREQDLNWTEIVEDNIKAVLQSDALIIEGSRYNYSQAYQTAIALQNNKPVLNLYRKDLPEYKEWPDRLFVSGIDSPLFHNVSYVTAEDVPRIIERFLKDISPRTTDITALLPLDTQSLEYIKEIASKTDKSIDTVIKDIIQRTAHS